MENTVTDRSAHNLLAISDSIFSSTVASLAMDPASRKHLTPLKYFTTAKGPGEGHKLDMNTVMIYNQLQSTSRLGKTGTRRLTSGNRATYFPA